MASTKVPLVAQWNLARGCVCTPDGGFLYVGFRSINYIGQSQQCTNDVPLVKAFHTRQNILSLDLDPAWPLKLSEESTATLKSQRFFAVVAQDNSVQIWDFDKGCAISGHKAHFNISRYMEGLGPAQHAEVLMSYMKNSSVLSLSSQDLVVYCVASNSYCRRPSFLPSRNHIWTILRCSPSSEYIFAVGSNRGLVLVCDIQKMQVVSKLHGHEASITSLAWNIVKIENVVEAKNCAVPDGSDCTEKEKTKEKEKAIAKKPELKKQKQSIDIDDVFDIYDYDYLDNEFGAPSTNAKTKADEIDATTEMRHVEHVESNAETMASENFDFAEACMSLKQDINALKNEPIKRDDDNTQVTIEDCKEVKDTLVGLSPSCSNESTEGSLELSARSSSDEGVDVDGVERNTKPQILKYQAEVHATQTEDTKNAVDESVQKTETCEPSKNDNDKTDKIEETEKIVPQAVENHIMLLASASVDCHYWVWNVSNGLACDNWKMRFTNGVGGQGKNTHIEISWLHSNKIITSNKNGDLAIRSVKPEVEGTLTKFKFVDEKRTFNPRGVVAFDIGTGNSENTTFMWSITYNREVFCENLKTQEIVGKYCCSSTNIHIMRECPDDMNKIAIAFTDCRIGILDISKLSSRNMQIENFSQKIDSIVMTLVWSPDSKKIAFATIKGRVGIINVDNPKQQTFIFNPISTKEIYAMDWKGNKIFVICGDNLGIYDAEGKSRDAIILNDLGALSALSIRDRFVFLGTRNGSIKIYTPVPSSTPDGGGELPVAPNWKHLKMVYKFTVSNRYITAFDWNPIAKNLCAVVCNENVLLIFDFRVEQPSSTTIVTIKRTIRMKHVKATHGIVKWSNQNEHMLVISGFDGFIRVYDLRNDTDDEIFIKYFHCPMNCALFMPTDENIILCAGKATSIEFVDMRCEESASTEATTSTRRSNVHALDNVQWATKMPMSYDVSAVPKTMKDKRRQRRDLAGVDLDDIKSIAGTTLAPPPPPPTKQVLAKDDPSSTTASQDQLPISAMLENLKIDATTTVAHNSNANGTNKCSAGEHCIASYMKIPPTLLYLTTKELNKDALVLLRTFLTNKGANILCSKLFGTKVQAANLLKTELENQQNSASKGISQIFMPQLTLNLKDEIIKCIQKRTLNAWHVAMAPSLSYSFWQKCCQAYAEQLLEQGFTLQAATYLLAMHKEYEAIDMLVQRNYFKEALLLGRIYLQPKDPILNTISDKWISFMDSTGNLAAAALLCALSDQMNRAHEILSRFRNPTQELNNILQMIKPTT